MLSAHKALSQILDWVGSSVFQDEKFQPRNIQVEKQVPRH